MCDHDKDKLDAIKERCLNWYWCYKDVRATRTSPLYEMLKRIELYSTRKSKEDEDEIADIRRFKATSLRPFRNQRDADLLQDVWTHLDEGNPEPLMVGVRFRMVAMPIYNIKQIIAVFVFAGRSYNFVSRKYRRALGVNASDYTHIEDLSLLYFSNKVLSQEKQ